MRVLIAGDSQAAGLLWHLRRRLPVVAADTRSGRPTSEFLGLPDLVQRARADVLVIALGGNDAMAIADPGAYRRMVRGLGTRLAQTGARVVWWGPARAIPADVDERHRAVSAAQQLALRGTGVRWLDSRLITQTGHGTDGVHFAAPTLRRWASAIAQNLAPPAAPWGWLLVLVGAAVGALAVAGRGSRFGLLAHGPVATELGQQLRRALDAGDTVAVERLATRAAGWVWSEADRARATKDLEVASGLTRPVLQRLLKRGEVSRSRASRAMWRRLVAEHHESETP